MDDHSDTIQKSAVDSDELSKFTESYASFNRIINSLQRKYIDLKEDFSAQNQQLAEANKKLVDLTRRNLSATRFLNGLLTSLAVGVISIDRNGHITHFNPAASVILGIPPKEPLNREYREVIPRGTPADANAVRTIETGREFEAIERIVETADGSKVHLSVSTAILTDKDGNPAGAVEVLHDLTKMKKMEQEIVRLNTLAALGEMAATIAHEVRNPLAGISGFASLLERDFDEDDPRRRSVQKILAGVNSLNETVATLLNYTRFEEVNRTDVDLKSFLEDVTHQYRSDNSARLAKTSFEIIPPQPPAESKLNLALDKVLFRQILFNLFGNAVEAFHGEGSISVTYCKLSRQAAVERHADRLLLGVD
ncbi:MAG: PAS domain-containing protein, partial [candidate division Zixibacteria bacterium]|nr:PAS domain-containing protein [candidate division Zixibacteria bacterium]